MSLRIAFDRASTPLVKLARWFLAPLMALGLASCGGGGHTGFKIGIVPPPSTSFRVPDDYDRIRVEVTVDESSQTYGQEYAISAVDPSPYVFVVLMDNAYHFEAKSLTVSLVKDGVALKTAIEEKLIVKQGSLAPVTIDFSQQ
jgi:hypothetical protein